MTLLNFVNYIDRYVLPAVAPRVKDALGLSDEQLGFMGSAFLLSYLATSPIFGYLGDRLSRTRLMAFGVALWSFATAGAGLARSFGQMLVARGTVGVGEASYAAISPALLSDYYPKERRGRVFAIFYLAIPVGSAVGYLLGGLLEHYFGWRAVFFAVGALVAPPAMSLVSNPLPVAVCVMLSALCQATFWPTFTAAGFGVNDAAPLIPLIVIVTSAVPPPLGVGVTIGDGLDV